MTDQELIAKAVFGEITLGEVFRRFEYRISAANIAVLRNSHPVGHDYDSWWFEAGRIIFVGGDETDKRRISFPLEVKVKVQDSCLEFRDPNAPFPVRMSLLETKPIKLILPGEAA